MARLIFGDGARVVSASYTGDSRSSAIYSNGDAISPFATPGDTGVILSTGRAVDFTQASGDPNRSPSTSTDTSGPNNNAMFNALAGTNTYDAAWLDITFIPNAAQMTMQFVFSSEEFPEFINSVYNDVVGVWVNGQHVPLAIGNGQISVNNLAPQTTNNLFVDNTGDAYNTEMDGFTVTMSLVMNVAPGVTNSIRIGIADTADAQYDSNLLIAANSIQTALIAQDDWVELKMNGSVTADLLGNDSGTAANALVITHINGMPVWAGSSITLTTGQIITLNTDGTVTVTADSDIETVNFTYNVQNAAGVSATGIVTVNVVPCFVAGTRIRTPAGEVPVESLRPGDLVCTLDDGPQPLRWAGLRRVGATGNMAPVCIRAGTFGAHGQLLVSPLHRLLVRDSLADLLFGEPEVLVAARDLVNGRSVVQCEGGWVDYVHLLFDRHQILFSEGLETESYLPGPQTLPGFDPQVQAEIVTLFPRLDPATGAGYGPSARPLLRRFEARTLAVGMAA